MACDETGALITDGTEIPGRAPQVLRRHDEFAPDVILPLERVLAYEKLKIGPDSARGAYSTLLKRISLPMDCANSFGLISPNRRTFVVLVRAVSIVILAP